MIKNKKGTELTISASGIETFNDDRPLRVISLGAGVQSSVLAVMAAKGEIPGFDMPDCAIFADTQAEPESVYEWLTFLESLLPFPVYKVSLGSLENDEGLMRVSKNTGLRYVRSKAPYWAWSEEKGAGGIVSRRCTEDYKIKPVQKAVRQLLGIYNKSTPPGILCDMWLGISTDEAHRAKPSRKPWIKNYHPLLDMGMSRNDCIAWAEAHNMPEPPRSACVFCPFHTPQEWLRLQRDEPEEYDRAVFHEEKMQTAFMDWDEMLKADSVFLQKHVPGVPLRSIDWQAFIESGASYIEDWGNECEGLCGI